MYEIKVHLLDIFAVVAYCQIIFIYGTLMTGETKQSLFEDMVFFVPECECCANVLVGIAESANAIFALRCQSSGMDNTQRYTRERAWS
jgi:hypothetical protein